MGNLSNIFLEQKNVLSTITLKDIDLNTYKFSPNVIVLAKTSVRLNQETLKASTTFKYIEVCNVKNTKPLAILESLIRYLIGEQLASNDFNNAFKDTGIRNVKVFKSFLNSYTIYRTDSDGLISKAITSQVKLSQTGLSVKPTHQIMLCDPKNRKSAIYRHALATMSQFTYHDKIVGYANSFVINESVNSEAKDKGQKSEEVGGVALSEVTKATKATKTTTKVEA